MPKFEYVASDARGEEKKGVVEAADQTAAISLIREKQLFPTSVKLMGTTPTRSSRGAAGKPAKGAKGKKSFLSLEMGSLGGGGKPKMRHVMVFTRQLSILLNAGMPLVRGLKVLERQERNVRLKNAIGSVTESIESGSNLAEALGQHPKIFNKLYINMVKAGELGGILDTVLDRLAVFMEKAEKIRGKVKSAMAYPVVVLVMAVGILSFLMIKIVPKFEEIFADMLGEKGLPALTQFVIGLSRGFASQWYFAVGVVAAVVFAWSAVRRNAKGKYVTDKLLLKIPLFGSLLERTAVARFGRTLGTLMNAGVPVLQALNIVRDTATNEVLASAVNTVHDSVKEGESMAAPAEATGVFPPIVTSMIQVGEETGSLPDMLIKIADTYEEEVDNAVAGITSVIEPVLIVFLAVVVGTIVIALFLPLIDIISNLSGGGGG